MQDCFTNGYVTRQKINPSFTVWKRFREHIIYSHESYVKNNGKNPRPQLKTLIIQSIATEIKLSLTSPPTKGWHIWVNP